MSNEARPLNEDDRAALVPERITTFDTIGGKSPKKLAVQTFAERMMALGSFYSPNGDRAQPIKANEKGD